MTPVLELRPAPLQRSGRSVQSIMWNVVLALLPASAFSVYVFGLPAALTLGVAVGSCLLAEWLVSRAQGTPSTLQDGSALITGLLYGLTLPPALPLWMTTLGGLLAIAVGKAAFGGLGKNCMNPALVGRAMLQALFPAAMTRFSPALVAGRFLEAPDTLLAAPLLRPTLDVVSGATPLSQFKFQGTLTEVEALSLGLTSGSAGETSALLIALGGAWLVARGMMNWRITVAVLGSVGLLSGALHAASPERFAPALFALTSGGLMLGAVFMATDMVGSPITHRGCVLYGTLIGTVVVAIRSFGALPEGVMYAILLGNACTPLIDRWVRPAVFGARRRRRVGHVH